MKAQRIVRNLLIILILVTSIGCDQISKNIVRHKMEYNEQINVISHYLILIKVENKGAFLGLGNTIPRPVYKIVMILLPLLVILFALFYLFRRNNLSLPMVTGISFIIAGGFGNLYDRILYGSVTDFIHMDFVLFRTGILNMADVSVTLGFFIILYDLYINRRRVIIDGK